MKYSKHDAKAYACDAMKASGSGDELTAFGEYRQELLGRTRAATDAGAIGRQEAGDAPWAMNMITHNSYGRFDEEIALVGEFQPDLVITALGGPYRVTEPVHR
ncbi:hypothetical protein [uncultured Tateyamaria sp.]|uniref:hypothetical protein n=1 Tax=uncultured Tateyamaria sp. TaxID=455651 RepID=UPI00260C61C6|nr:hypothetical protein [uncultured Tateyamaria sp.]